MTLRSLAPCLRAAREKHRFAAGKKHRNGKNTLGSRKKTPCSGKKLFPQREKTPAKNAASQREKFKAAEKTPCSSTKAPLQQKKCILEAAGKNRPRREKPVRGKKKTGRGRKKPSSRESPALQPKKLPQRKKYISATGKSSSPIKTGPPRRHRILCSRSMPWTRQHCSEGNWRCPGPLPALLSRAPARSKECLHGSFWSWNHQISAPRTVHPCFLATVRTFEVEDRQSTPERTLRWLP